MLGVESNKTLLSNAGLAAETLWWKTLPTHVLRLTTYLQGFWGQVSIKQKNWSLLQMVVQMLEVSRLQMLLHSGNICH